MAPHCTDFLGTCCILQLYCNLYNKGLPMSVCLKSSFFLLFPGLELLKYLLSFVTLSMLLVNSIWPLNVFDKLPKTNLTGLTGEAWALCISKVIPFLLRKLPLPNERSRKRCAKTYSFCHSLWFLLRYPCHIAVVLLCPLQQNYIQQALRRQQKFRHLPQGPGRTRPYLFLFLLLVFLALSWLQTGSGRNRKYEESTSAGVTGMD